MRSNFRGVVRTHGNSPRQAIAKVPAATQFARIFSGERSKRSDPRGCFFKIRASRDWLRVSPYPLALSAGQQRRPGPSQLQQGPGPVQMHRMFHEEVWLLSKAKKSVALCACFRYFGELRWWGIATLPCREENFKYIRRINSVQTCSKGGHMHVRHYKRCTSVQERRYDGHHSADVAISSEESNSGG